MARVKVVAAEFVTSAVTAAGLPRTPLPELALAGRSNVGKSSLINVLAGRTLARTSAAPGKTRLANYYRLQPERGRAFHLVDLPGYGYARAPRTAALRGAGPRVLLRGAEGRLDAPRHRRRGPPGGRAAPGPRLRRRGVRLVRGAGLPVPAVATKADKLSRAERQRATAALVTAFGRDALMTSVPSGEGIDELWAWIAQQVESWKQPSR